VFDRPSEVKCKEHVERMSSDGYFPIPPNKIIISEKEGAHEDL
jgi:hypothetical protein